MTAFALTPAFSFSFFRRDTATSSPEDTVTPDTLSDQRAFLTEVMDRCPDAFRSEEDVHAMMTLYPGRF